ncbi:RDD family protein, partial [Planctomycetota bacterium]
MRSIRYCPDCEIRVYPMKDGRCPNCKEHRFSDTEESTAEEIREQAPEPADKPENLSKKASKYVGIGKEIKSEKDLMPLELLKKKKPPIYAGFLLRFPALLIDALIFWPVRSLFRRIDNLSRLNYIYTFVLWYGLFVVWHICFVKWWGGTPGKLFMEIRIVKEDFHKVGWREAILRESVIIVLTLIGSIVYIYVLLQISDKQFL